MDVFANVFELVVAGTTLACFAAHMVFEFRTGSVTRKAPRRLVITPGSAPSDVQVSFFKRSHG